MCVRRRTECVCSFVSPSLASKADAYHCDVPCPGSSSSSSAAAERTCGGRGHYTVFSTGSTASRVAGDSYVGCYAEDETRKDAAAAAAAAVDFPYVNTPKTCSKHCYRAGYRYFGLSYRQSCWCANAPPRFDLKVLDGECGAQCPGDANKYCGGVFRTAVFQLGERGRSVLTHVIICECVQTKYVPRRPKGETILLSY